MHEVYLRYQVPIRKNIGKESSLALEDTRSSVKQRSAMIWSEHCSECAMPDCFSSCEFYSPRSDLKCQRFQDGIAPVYSGSKYLPESMFISFKKWGKLEATTTATMINSFGQGSLLYGDKYFERLLNNFPVPYFLKLKIVRFSKRLMEKFAQIGERVDDEEDVYFLIEVINLEKEELYFNFCVREFADRRKSFQKKITLHPGHNKVQLKISEFHNVSLSEKCLFQFEPEESSEKANLIVGMLDFVKFQSKPVLTPKAEKNQKVKAVVWDLDNTIWDGTLVEDGLDELKLRPAVVSTIVKLDEMGILNSIASKNNIDDALSALRRFGLEQYFLYPQVSWNPKSASIKQIQQSLNIGMNSIIFIDDQVFERTEVAETLRDVRVYSDEEVDDLLNLPEFKLPVTNESKRRRKMYQENQVRENALVSSDSDYIDFLTNCNIQITLNSLSAQSLGRIHELSQRTNQMNFSGNRYSKSQLSGLIGHETKKTFVISCGDKFGDYGVVGFAIIDDSSQTLNDLMFSCRIQAKQIEHTFLKHIFGLYKAKGADSFSAEYRPTKKNAQSGKVFDDVGFELVSESEGMQLLKFNLSNYDIGKSFIRINDKTV